LAFQFANPLVCQTILPDLDLPEWFAKLIWHLYLANHFAAICKLVCQTILPDLDLPKNGLPNQFGI
jgi:hypothetical protein